MLLFLTLLKARFQRCFSSFSVLFQYSGGEGGMCEKQEGLGPMHMPPSACVPILLPRRPGPPTEDPAGVSKEAQHAGLPLRELHREGQALLRLGGWLRRYGQLTHILGWGAACRAWPCSLLSVGCETGTFSSYLFLFYPLWFMLSLLTSHSFTLLPSF